MTCIGVILGRLKQRRKRVQIMQYSKSKMEELVKYSPDLSKRLKEVMKEHDLEKSFALKALYHSEVKDGGKYQRDYQDL